MELNRLRRLVDPSDPLNRQLLENLAMLQHSVQPPRSEIAGPAGELLQALAVSRERLHPQIRDLAAAAELDARQIRAAEGDNGEGLVG